MALWHAAALFVGAAAAEALTAKRLGPVYQQPWFKAARTKPAQVTTDDDLVYGAKRSPT